MWDVLVETFPIGAITLLVIWISAAFISKPLWQLANVVKSFENRTSAIRDLNEVKPWYFEASHLKCSFLSAFNIVSNTIDQLHIDTLTDSMTGLLNRRGLDKAIDNLRIQNTPFSVLALDVDYFKKVNDTLAMMPVMPYLSVWQILSRLRRERWILSAALAERSLWSF